MKTDIKDKGPSELSVRVELDRNELEQYMHQVQNDWSREIAVDGFRKGKAPREIAGKHFDPAAVREAALEHALEDSFSRVAEAQHWEIAKTADLKVETNAADRLVFTVSVFVYPAVTLPDLATIKIAREPIVVTSEDEQEALETLRSLKASFLDKEGPAREGDRVEVNFQVMHDGQPIEGGQSTNHPLVIGGKNFMPGFEEQLVGMKTGETKQFELTAPADYYHPAIAGKKLNFSVTLNKIQAVDTPEITDAFASSLGKFKDVGELKQKIHDGLVKEKEDKERQRVRLAILDAIIGQLNVVMPSFLLEDELEAMIGRFSSDLSEKGTDLNMYLAHLKKTRDELKKDWRADAERQVKIALVLRTLAKEQKISVTPAEVDAAAAQTVQEAISNNVPQDQINIDDLRRAIAQRMVSDKTLRLLEETCAA